MVQSVELLVDETTEDAVVREWSLLIDADLPSAGRHRGPSNRPHVTLFAGATLPDDREPGLTELAARLPLPLRLGGLVLFGRSEFVLARLVVPSADLLALQALVTERAGPESAVAHARAGEWTGHVTLGRRLRPAQVGQALEVLSDLRDLSGTATALRRWDGEAKREWLLSG